MPARPPPSIVMLQTVMRPSIESASIAGPAYSTTCPVAPPTPIWPIVPRIRSFALTPSRARPRSGPASSAALWTQALGRQHVLDLARADAEGERTEGAVRRGVGVAADDRHARLRDAELRADHVHDSLVRGAERVDGDPELLAVALERLHLDARELVLDPCGVECRPWARCGRRSRASGPGAARRGPASRRPSNACGLVTSWTRCRSM